MTESERLDGRIEQGCGERARTGLSVAALKQDIIDNLFFLQGRFRDVATRHDYYMALAYTVRDRLLERWITSAQCYKNSGARTVCYLSAEFLLGPHLGANLINLGIWGPFQQALRELDLDLDQLLEEEEEPGLGNGGLGRLAACYMESMASLQYPAIGYGIRYEFGIFDQRIEQGRQVEVTDAWLRNGNPWELRQPKLRFAVKFGGRTYHSMDDEGQLRVHWKPDLVVNGVAYDTPILGYGVTNANLLRLWTAEACESFDFQAFNIGNYYKAVEAKIIAESISKVLYPNDEPEVGKELRLKQQYFFVSCALQDMLRLHLNHTGSPLGFERKFVVQLNDTHPAIAVAELMRLLVDVQGLGWDKAWDIVRHSFAFTNHTLLPEALETWPVELMHRLLPRHLEIIYEINHRFLDEVRVRYLNDNDRLARLSLIDEAQGRRVRMAHLACVGSFAVNGVAELHSELLKTRVLGDFHDLWPHRFHNVTNGVTPRRFIALSNPRLKALLDECLGPDWVRHLELLRGLESHAGDAAFQARWREVKTAAKQDLAAWIHRQTGIRVDPASAFDIQVKRLHEYKRQHLNILHVIGLYLRLKEQPGLAMVPRTFIFGGKAAPGYHLAKLIIRLITAVGEMLERDPQIKDRLRVVFVPDFNVKNGQRIYPAADISEQISLAGKEASGTGNMKFCMNGALTIGTLDGANLEIRRAVGEENFFLFGLDVEQVRERLALGYRPQEIYQADPELQRVIGLIASGVFAHGDRELFRPLVDNLLQHDPYLVLADFASYAACQARVDLRLRDQAQWTRMSILNVARSGYFSSDRAVREYAERIWRIEPLPVATIA